MVYYIPNQHEEVDTMYYQKLAELLFPNVTMTPEELEAKKLKRCGKLQMLHSGLKIQLLQNTVRSG